jgi:2-polyprenyl-6-methoxyphenol hydroxylase-like FAD-dependent oxidoreductase
MSTHFLSGRHIVVAGAGLSGLSFAIALRKLWPESVTPPHITIFERDTEADAEGRQGYSLSLAGYDETGGLVALRDLGLLDEILPHAITGLGGAGCFKIWDNNWSEIMSVRFRPAEGLPSSGIRVARRDLRRTLLAAVADEIHWGTACVSAAKTKDGKVSIQLAGTDVRPDESTMQCDFLVVADGASSKIRTSLRPDDVLQFAGATQMVGIASFPDGSPAQLRDNWGLQISWGDGVTCFYSPVDHNNVLWALGFLEQHERPREEYNSQQAMQALLKEARERGAKPFGSQFQTIVDATENPKDVACLSARDKKPFRHDLDEAAIVFIGDSNHAVSPFAGYGASLALKDGWDLSKALVSSSTAKEAIQKYDAVSVPRALKILDSSRWRIKYGHSTGFKHLFFRTILTLGGYILWLTGRG